MMETVIGSVTLSGPVMTASGTAGYGDELAPFMDLSELGAVVTKSLAPYEWPGNPAPRVHPTPQGMMNAVGLQGPGIEYWLGAVLPDLLATGATVVASIWGRSLDDYRRAAEMLAEAPPGVVAVEVNLSCPEPRRPRLDLRPRRRAVRRGDRSHRGMRPTSMGETEREHRPDHRGCRCRP